MPQKNLSIQYIAYFLIVALIGTYILHIGKFFIIPFVFAALLSIIVLPIQQFYDRFIKIQAIGSVFTFFSVLIPIVAIIGFFSVQVSQVLSNLNNISVRLQKGTDTLFLWISQYFQISVEESQSYLRDNVTSIISSPISLLQSTFSSFGSILLNTVLIFLFMFFMLSYRIALKNFVLMQFDPLQRQGIGGIMI